MTIKSYLFFALLFVSSLHLGFAQEQKKKVQLQFDHPMQSGQELNLIVAELIAIEIMLLNPEGNFIKLLLKQELMAGNHQIPVILSDIPAGDYQLQMITPNGKEIQSLTIKHSPPSPAGGSTRFPTLPSKPWTTEAKVSIGAQITSKTATSIQGVGKNYTLSFANPATSGDDLTLTVTQLSDFKITVLNQDNKFVQLLMHQELMAGEHNIPMILSDLQTGSYLLNIEVDGETETQALDIKH